MDCMQESKSANAIVCILLLIPIFIIIQLRINLTAALLFVGRASATTFPIVDILSIALVLPLIVDGRLAFHVLPIQTLLLEVFIGVIIRL